MPDISTVFGALKPKRKFVSIEEETEGMEKAIGKQVGSKSRSDQRRCHDRGLDKFPGLKRHEARP
jgi:hypothetical protein